MQWLLTLTYTLKVIYTSLSCASIVSNNGLLPVWCQAIISANIGSLDTWEQISVKLNQNATLFFQENEFENVICIIVVILYWSQCVNWAQCKIYLRLIIWFNFPFYIALLKASTNIWIHVVHYSVKLSISQMVRSPTLYLCYWTTFFLSVINSSTVTGSLDTKEFLTSNGDLLLISSNLIQVMHHIDGLVQDCSISSALAMELLQSCTKPSILGIFVSVFWNYEIWMFFSINHDFYVGSSFIYFTSCYSDYEFTITFKI